MRRFSTSLAALLIGHVLCAGCGGNTSGKPPGGIYAKLGYSEGGGLRVIQVPPGGAADLAGIRVDDVIIAIDGTSVRELDYQTIVERLRGPAGSTVRLDVFRDAEVDSVVVTRQAYTR
jgi:C-terminal processing protease CtpA/Prc